MKETENKITDYIRFGQVLLALSTILFVGLLLPKEKIAMQLYILMGTVSILLVSAFFFFYRANFLQKQIDETEQL